MELEKLKNIADMFLNCLNEVPEQCSGEATVILQDLIQKAMVKLSKGKVRTIIFEAVKESSLTNSALQQIEPAPEPAVVAQAPVVVPTSQANQELDNWVNAMLYQEQEAEPAPDSPEIDNTPGLSVSLPTETVITEPRRPGRPRKLPGPSIVDKYFTLTLEGGTKIFLCAVCRRQFKDKSNLGRHLRTHAGERPFACTFCEKRFTQKVHLQAHERIHTGEKPYICGSCNKNFTTRRSLDQHSFVHTKIKRFKCDVCSKAFGFKQKLQMHMLRHTGQKPFKCEVCTRGFTRAEILKSHRCPGHPVKESPKTTPRKRPRKEKDGEGEDTAGSPGGAATKEDTSKDRPRVKQEKMEEDEEEEAQTLTVQTEEGEMCEVKAVMNADHTVPPEICFEVIENASIVGQAGQEITIVEVPADGQTFQQMTFQENQGEPGTLVPVGTSSTTSSSNTTVLHDLSCLPESLRALIQAATAVSSPTEKTETSTSAETSTSMSVADVRVMEVTETKRQSSNQKQVSKQGTDKEKKESTDSKPQVKKTEGKVQIVKSK